MHRPTGERINVVRFKAQAALGFGVVLMLAEDGDKSE
jgi:hypothetical protein